jgi:hypothetical protein
MSKKTETQPEEDHTRIYELGNRVSRSTVAVIDTMVQRGAVKGEELSTLGQLRDQSVQLIQMAETYQQDAAADSD